MISFSASSRIATLLAIVVLLGTSAGQSTQQPLAAYRVFWNTTLSDFAMISVCANAAEMAAVDGDLIRAARVLAYGQQSANAASGALHRIPPEWHDRLRLPLAQAMNAFNAANNALRVYFAHGKVADLKAAQSDLAQASGALVNATAAAKAGYSAIGGHAGDLENLPHATQSANAALAAAMGDTDTDDQ